MCVDVLCHHELISVNKEFARVENGVYRNLEDTGSFLVKIPVCGTPYNNSKQGNVSFVHMCARLGSSVMPSNLKSKKQPDADHRANSFLIKFIVKIHSHLKKLEIGTPPHRTYSGLKLVDFR